jgi:hypothetical protein
MATFMTTAVRAAYRSFSSLYSVDKLWVPLIIMFNRFMGCVMVCITHLVLGQGLIIVALYLQPPMRIHGVVLIK